MLIFSAINTTKYGTNYTNDKLTKTKIINFLK